MVFVTAPYFALRVPDMSIRMCSSLEVMNRSSTYTNILSDVPLLTLVNQQMS
jgi:hypothetical protein